MTQTSTYQQMGTAARGEAHALFAQTMAYVAATAGLFALGFSIVWPSAPRQPRRARSEHLTIRSTAAGRRSDIAAPGPA